MAPRRQNANRKEQNAVLIGFDKDAELRPLLDLHKGIAIPRFPRSTKAFEKMNCMYNALWEQEGVW
jgi:hypothetical protein